MSLDQKISALTASLQSIFWKSWQETAKPAPWEIVTTIVPSTTRIEHYVNFGPVPGIREWKGNRNYGAVRSFIYSLQNKTWTAGFTAALEDIEDDQTGGLAMKPKELSIKGKKFPGRSVMDMLNQGTTLNAFDGTPFAGSSHNFGTGNNSLTFTTADAGTSSPTHARTYNLWALYYGDEILKPLIWQNRAAPLFRTNSGQNQSYESRQVRWWVDMRGIAGYGWWWNATYMQITGLPNVTEMYQIYQQIEQAFRTYQMPKTGSDLAGEYVHEQTEFEASNLCLVGSTYLAQTLRQSLNLSWVPQAGINVGGTGSTSVATENLFKGWARYFVSRFLDSY
jgi:phage major head subunit gpT-like protein